MRARIGLGTYRCPDVGRAAFMAARSGADWLDTAPNYAGGKAERALAPILAQHPDVRISTKVGFLSASAKQQVVVEGVLGQEQALAGHVLAPAYVGWQVAQSRAVLGRVPDLVFVHNPEHHCPPDEIDERLYAAFTALEQACADGLIRAYGVATWSGFASGLFDVPTLLKAAFRAGGTDHRLRAVQLSLSLVHLAPIADALDGRGVLADARAAGLSVFASAPLHGGEVPGLLTPDLVELLGMDPTTMPAQAALAVVGSAPGGRRVLLSTTRREHWEQAVTVLDRPVLSRQTLQRIADVLGT